MIEYIKTPKPETFQQWDILLESSPFATFFQTSECYNFYKSASFTDAFFYGLIIDGSLKAVMSGYITAEGNGLKKVLSLRAIIPGGVLLDENVNLEVLCNFLIFCKSELSKKNVIYAEIRNYNEYSKFKIIFEKAGYLYNQHLNFHIPVTAVETAFQKLNTTKRRDIRSSQKSGVTWRLTTAEADMKAYYALLKQLYMQKIKTPLFPPDFFLEFLKLPNGRFLVVEYQKEIIGGSVCVELPGRVLYEWFVCGRDGEYKNVFPSTVATWAAIEYAAQNGIKRFDMMGAGKPDEAYGVREFKSKFGGELVEHGRFLCVLNPLLYQIGKMGVKYLKSRRS